MQVVGSTWDLIGPMLQWYDIEDCFIDDNEDLADDGASAGAGDYGIGTYNNDTSEAGILLSNLANIILQVMLLVTGMVMA